MSGVIFLVPYRSDNGRRDALWDFTRLWLERNHPHWSVVLGKSPEGPFNRGAAINDAAHRADDWDVAIVCDADNICDSASLELAVERVRETKSCVFPFSTYMYLDEFSTDRLIKEDNWFVSPEQRGGFNGIIFKHTSGVQVIHRRAWDKIGGYVELVGWGYEDSCTASLLRAFVGPIEHLGGAAYHLYHENATALTANKATWGVLNKQVLADVLSLEMLPDQLREYLRMGGHPIP